MRDVLFADIETESELDLTEVSTPVYAEHPSTRVERVGWNYRGAEGTWVPASTQNVPPATLTDAIGSCGLVAFFNAEFDFTVLRARLPGLGLPMSKLMCIQHRALASGLRKVRKTGESALSLREVLELMGAPADVQKLSEEQIALTGYSWTKSAKNSGLFPIDSAAQEAARDAYVLGDVRAIAWLDEKLPMLSEFELECFRSCLAMNLSGMPIDRPLLERVHAIGLEAATQAEIKFHEATGLRATQRQAVQNWLAERGVNLKDMTRETLTGALKAGTIPPDMAQLVRWYAEVGAKPHQKFAEILRLAQADDRLRGTLRHAVSHTGRDVGRHVNLQNAKRPDLDREGQMALAEFVRSGASLEAVEMVFGSAAMAMTNLQRAVFTAPEGKWFADGDFTRAEPMVGFWLTGERDSDQPYHEIGVRIANGMRVGKSREEWLRLPIIANLNLPGAVDVVGVEHISKSSVLYTTAKSAFLGCFGAVTPVLTEGGWKPIETVTSADRVFDGVEFVACDGAVCMGEKETITLCGMTVTPEHLVLTSHDWRQAQDLQEQQSHLQSALELADSSFSNIEWQVAGGTLCVAATAGLSGSLTSSTSSMGEPHSVAHAAGWTASARIMSGVRQSLSALCSEFSASSMLLEADTRSQKSTPSRVQDAASLPRSVSTETTSGKLQATTTVSVARENSFASPKPSGSCATLGKTCKLVAAPGMSSISHTMLGGGSKFASDGICLRTSEKTDHICRGLENLAESRSTASTTTETTSPETADGQPAPSRRETNVVFDVVNAGPRSRYVVLTEAGPLIVHNSGYGQQAKGLHATLADRGISIPMEVAQAAVKACRDAKPKTFAMAEEIMAALVQAAAGRITKIADGKLIVRPYALGVEIGLPSGRAIRYRKLKAHRYTGTWGMPRLEITYTPDLVTSKTGKELIQRIHVGTILENVFSAIARDFLYEAVNRAVREGIEVVLGVHDQILALVDGEEGRAHLERIMNAPTPWSRGFAMKAEVELLRRFMK